MWVPGGGARMLLTTLQKGAVFASPRVGHVFRASKTWGAFGGRGGGGGRDALEGGDPPTKACMIHSKQYRGCRIQWLSVAEEPTFGTVHGAPPLPNAPMYIR